MKKQLNINLIKNPIAINKNKQKVFSFLIRAVILCCFVSFPVYASKYSHVWGEETRSGIWQPKSYELHHGGFKSIKHPEKCERRSCITLHISCTYADYSNMKEKKFSANVLIERHPDHPKQPNPFKVPSYSAKTSIWLNDQKFQTSLERSSLFYSFLYGPAYFWTVSFDKELFDQIPVRELKFRMESEDQLLKIKAVFDLSKERGVFQYMKSICSRPEEKKEDPKKPPSPLVDPKKLF